VPVFFCACCCQCCPTFEVAQAIEIGSAFRFECSAGVFSPASFFCFCTFVVIFETAIRSKQLITLRDSTQTQQTCHPECSVAPLLFPSRSGGRRVAMGPPRSTVSRAWGRGKESGRNTSEGSALFLPMCWARSCQANPRCRHATKKRRPKTSERPNPAKYSSRVYAFFLFFNAFNASVKRDLYRFAVFSVSVRLRIALSTSEKVPEANFSAPATSPDVNAARIRRIAVRTRVRFIRLMACRVSACRIFFNTDFVFFLCFTAPPCAIHYSLVVLFQSSRVSDPPFRVNLSSSATEHLHRSDFFPLHLCIDTFRLRL